MASEDATQKWQQNILDQRQSGLSIAAWCRQNAIPCHIFHYWQRKLSPKPFLTRSAFSELASKEAAKPTITLEYQGFSIHLDQHFDSIALKRCLEVLKKC